MPRLQFNAAIPLRRRRSKVVDLSIKNLLNSQLFPHRQMGRQKEPLLWEPMIQRVIKGRTIKI